jgi:hypothetical protein
MGLQHETMPVTSDAASVPTWDLVNHTRLAIETPEAPAPSSDAKYAGAGVSVPGGEINRTHNKAFSLNATNLQPQMNLSYTDRWTIRCTDQGADPLNFTVRLNTPLINSTRTAVSLTSNAKAIKIRCNANGNGTSFAYNFAMFSTPVCPSIYPNVTGFMNMSHYFRFNISHAAEVFASRGVLTGDSFLFEVNYTVTVQFSSWSVAAKSGEKFRIEGNQSTRQSNKTLSFRVSGPKGVNITFHYFTTDLDCTSNHVFRADNVPFTPTFDTTLKGWRIAPGGSVKLNATGTAFSIDYRVNATVGFVDKMAGRWTSDGMASRLDTRTRKFKLAVLSGPSALLVENIEFVSNDIAYSTKMQATSSATPTTIVTIVDDTYQVPDPLQEGELITKSNGTKVSLRSIQKTFGPVTVSFNYNASYGASLRILDDLRNPLSGAEVTLYFHGVRFGSLMSVNGSNLQPIKITNDLGIVTYNYLPEGNYSVEVHAQGRVKVQEFSLYGGARSVSIDVVTDIPYQPWILVAWVAIFGLLSVVGISLFKKKR